MQNWMRSFLLAASFLMVFVAVAFGILFSSQRQAVEATSREMVGQQAHMLRSVVSRASGEVVLQLQQLFIEELAQREEQEQWNRSEPLSDSLNQSLVLGLGFFQKDENGSWASKWQSLGHNLMDWSPDLLGEKILSQSLAKISGDKVKWYRLMAPAGRPVWAVISRIHFKHKDQSQTGLLVGYLPLTYLNELSVFSKSEKTMLRVFNENGHVLASPKQAYVGSSISHQEVIKKILSGEKAAGLQKTSAGWIAFERVPETNTFVMSERSPAKFIWSGFVNLAVVAAGMILLMAAGYQWLFRKIDHVPVEEKSKAEPSAEPTIESEPEEIKPLESTEPVHTQVAGAVEAIKPSYEPTLKRFAEGVYESLKGPLTMILGHIQVARTKGGGHSELQNEFEILEREARSAKKIISDIHDVIGDENLAPENIELMGLFESALVEIKNTQIKGYRWKIEKELNLEAQVKAHPRELRSALKALIQNAFEATVDEEFPYIKLNGAVFNGKARLTIEDNGPGVAKDDLNHVFEPFFTRKDPEVHPGLGLSMAMGIIKKFQGDVRVETLNNKGVRVIVELPSDSKNTEFVKIEDVEPQETTLMQAFDRVNLKQDFDLKDLDDFNVQIRKPRPEVDA